MGESAGGNKIANKLVAVSSAAVLAVYAAGYNRTRGAAERMEVQSVRRPMPVRAAAIPAHLVVAPATPTLTASITPPTSVEKAVVVAKAAPAAETPAPEPVAVAAPPPPAATPAPPPAPESVPQVSAPPPAVVYKDGTYTGWGTSRHGDIEAKVVIENGKIASATISQCRTRYSCSVIEALPPEVAQRQSPEVDYVTGATQSTNAFYYGVVEALGKAK